MSRLHGVLLAGNTERRRQLYNEPSSTTDGLATAAVSLAAQLVSSITPSQPPLLTIEPIRAPGIRWDKFSNDTNTYDLVGRVVDSMELDEFSAFTGQLDDQGLPSGGGSLVGQDFYEGEFVSGKRDGFGTSYHDGGTGIRYEGEFVSDHPHGFGVAYRRPTDGGHGGSILFDGQWRSGEPFDGIEYGVTGNVVYEGRYINGARAPGSTGLELVSDDETTQMGQSVLVGLSVVIGMLMAHRRRQRDLRQRLAAAVGKERAARQRAIYETALESRARFNENKVDTLPSDVRRRLLQLAAAGSDDPCSAIDAFCRTSRGMCEEDDVWQLALRLAGFVAVGEVYDPRRTFYEYCGSFSKIERGVLLRPA